MKYNSKLARELEHLINNALDTSELPYVKGKSIRIKHIIVRETRVGFFLVFDTKENKEVAKMFCKTSAVALAKSLAKDRNSNVIKDIRYLDDIIEKNYNDALFHKHILKSTKDRTRRFVAETRYEMAASKTRDAKEKLDRYIYI
jgi:ribosomal protein L22